MPEEKIFKYPNPDKLQINESDLKLKLKEYHDAVKREVSFLDLFIIIAAWSPIFISEFKDVWGISGSIIFGAYIAIVSIGTILWLVVARNSFIKIWKGKIKKDESWLKLNRTDPNDKVSDIKNESEAK